METTNTYLALDFGGTKLLVGELSDKGQVLNLKKYGTGYVDQLQALEIITSAVNDYMATIGWATGKKPAAMGIGLIGRVDNDNGIWCQIDPKRNQSIELAALLSEKYGMPCFIDNDVKSAAKAEKWIGRGAGTDHFIYLNIGTGIASASVVNGKVVRGGHNNAGEVGHTSVGVNTGMQCGCGRMDCVELIASGMGFDKQARLLHSKFATQLALPETNPVNVRDIYQLAQQGDPLCVHLAEQASTAIAYLIMNLVRVTDPELVVLGGGIVSDAFMLKKVQEKLNPTTIRFVKKGIVLTSLDPNFAGLIGAGAVAMNL